MKIVSLSAALIAAAGAVSAQDMSEMEGTWASIACEVRPQPNQDGTMGN